MRFFRMFPLLLAPFILGLSGCEDVATSPDTLEEGTGTGMVAFRFSSAQVDSLAKQVDTLEIVLDNGKRTWARRTGLSTEVDFSDVPAGSWKLAVRLRQGGVAKYEGSTQVTVASGATTDAKVMLSAVSGGLRIEIGFDDDGIATSLPKALVGTWYLSELPGTGAVMDTVPLVFSEDGTGGGSDGCNFLSGTWSAPADSVIRLAFGMTTLKACFDSAGIMVDKGYKYRRLLAGDVVWSVERMVGVGGDVRMLTLKNPKTGSVVGRYSNLPPKSVLTPFVPVLQSNPANFIGVWGLVSMPIEGLDSAAAMLVFDSLGGVSGIVACNAASGSWKLDGDGKLLVTMSDSTGRVRVCGDSTAVLTERGIHLMASVPLDWSIDTTFEFSQLERITVSSSATGDTIAVFSLSRFGVTYYPTPVVPLDSLAPIVVPSIPHPGLTDPYFPE